MPAIADLARPFMSLDKATILTQKCQCQISGLFHPASQTTVKSLQEYYTRFSQKVKRFQVVQKKI